MILKAEFPDYVNATYVDVSVYLSQNECYHRYTHNYHIVKHTYTHTHSDTHANKHTHTNAHMHTPHTHTQTHTHTHKHTGLQTQEGLHHCRRSNGFNSQKLLEDDL